MVDASVLMQIIEQQLNQLGLGPINNPWNFNIINMATTGGEIVTDLYDLLHGIFDNFLGIGADLTQTIHLFDFMPNAWVSLFLIILIIVVVLRIYAYFSDISIGGFKI